MTITSSIVANLTPGSNVISLPQSGMNLVGLSINSGYLTIPIKTGIDAIILSQTGPWIQEVNLKLTTNTFTVNSLQTAFAILYFGLPRAGSPTLEDYAGVVFTPPDIDIPISGQPANATGSVQFPGGGFSLTGFNTQVPQQEYGAYLYPTVSFHTKTGNQLTIFGYDSPAISQKLGSDNIISLDLSMPDILNFTYGIYAGTPPSTAYSTTFSMVFYYKMGGRKQ